MGTPKPPPAVTGLPLAPTAPTRAYCAQKVSVSLTGEFGGEEYVAYDTGTEYGPPESPEGNSISFEPVVAQFVRHWSAGSTVNPYVHFLEIDVFGSVVGGSNGRRLL
eukprot:SAG22_NODE_4706_length_1185_cov_4.361878_2_plen_107_part_00